MEQNFRLVRFLLFMLFPLPILNTFVLCNRPYVLLRSLTHFHSNNIISFFSDIRGFIKTNFCFTQINGINYGFASITDGKYKLDIQIIDNSELQDMFEKGQHVEIKGFIKLKSKIHNFSRF